MQLTRHIQQGKLIYFTQDDEMITVNENKFYRWLAFDDVIQSVMLKREPWQLTLPHQTALMLPLLYIQPKTVIEFGLGGGNLSRFLLHHIPTLSLHTVEYSAEVKHCFDVFFNPDNCSVNLHHNSALDWLHQNKKHAGDWYICDIYQRDQLINDSIILTKNILKKIKTKAIISLNLPCPSNDDINYFLETLRQLAPNKHIVYFHVPHYLNVIIHIIPRDLLPTPEMLAIEQSILPERITKKWLKFWKHGLQYSSN
jgi:spermidine synthase